MLFIIFGEVMNKCGMGQFFNDIANALAGHTKGGPAKVAVLASGFLGSINGSAVANVVTTGTFTIPLMKKTGYSKEFAGSVEATASVGGQLLPPIMGAAAFVMAETLGVKYGVIIRAAVIPALLYYMGILVQVQMRATKENLNGLPKEQMPKAGQVMKERGHLLIPIAFLLYMLIWSGRTVIFSAFWTIIVTILVAELRPISRMSLKDICDAFVAGAKSTVPVAIACACVGIIVGVCGLTGFALNVAHAIIRIGQSSVLLTLVFTMITCMILGMGLPHHRDHRRSRARRAGPARACRAPVLLLLCDVRKPDAACRACIVRGGGPLRRQPDEDRLAVGAAGARGLYHPVHVHV